MRVIGLDELRGMPDAGRWIDWLPQWWEDALHRCFRFLAIELQPYEKFNSDGAVCLLGSGTGVVCKTLNAAGREPVTAGAAFGLRKQNAAFEPLPEWFLADTPSVILCVGFNIFDSTCFGMGCSSMHTRVREMIIAGAAIRRKEE